MEKTIWKYPLHIGDEQDIEVPVGAKFLSALEQSDTPVLYFIVDPEAPTVPLRIYILGTNRPGFMGILDSKEFLGSVPTYSGGLIWHIFSD